MMVVEALLFFRPRLWIKRSRIQLESPRIQLKCDWKTWPNFIKFHYSRWSHVCGMLQVHNFNSICLYNGRLCCIKLNSFPRHIGTCCLWLYESLWAIRPLTKHVNWFNTYTIIYIHMIYIYVLFPFLQPIACMILTDFCLFFRPYRFSPTNIERRGMWDSRSQRGAPYGKSVCKPFLGWVFMFFHPQESSRHRFFLGDFQCVKSNDKFCIMLDDVRFKIRCLEGNFCKTDISTCRMYETGILINGCFFPGRSTVPEGADLRSISYPYHQFTYIWVDLLWYINVGPKYTICIHGWCMGTDKKPHIFTGPCINTIKKSTNQPAMFNTARAADVGVWFQDLQSDPQPPLPVRRLGVAQLVWCGNQYIQPVFGRWREFCNEVVVEKYYYIDICMIFTSMWGNDPIWLIFFSDGLKPATC